MPKLIYFIACEKVLVDPNEQVHSMISVMEKFIVPKLPERAQLPQAAELPPAPHIPLNWNLVSYFEKLPQDENKEYEQRTLVVLPNDETFGEIVVPFTFLKGNHRNIVKIFGFPVGLEGRYSVKLFLREKGEAAWVELFDYPILVELQ